MNYVILNEELEGDPLARGYAGMSNLEAADDLNTVYRESKLKVLDGAVVYDRIDTAEFQAKTDDEKAEVWNITHLGPNILIGAGSKAQTRFVAIFGAGSTTISNLQDAITSDITRGVELGLGQVHEGDVLKARAVGG